MKLRCLGSGSSGNCYILENDSEALVIEAGLPFMVGKKALDFNISKIVGVVISHSHGDHAKYAGEYEKAGIPVFRPYESEMERQVRSYGEFVIRSFPLVHDVPCYGFLICHPETGKVLYASDTEYIKYRFRNLNHILIECNYSKELIPEDAVNRSHVMTGHMELQTTLDFLRTNNNPNLRSVILLHISARNSDPDEFVAETGKVVQCPVWASEKWLEVDLLLSSGKGDLHGI